MKLPKVIVFDVGGTLVKNLNLNYDKAFAYLKLIFKADESFIDRCNEFKKLKIDTRDITGKETSFKELVSYLSNYYELNEKCDSLFVEENFRKSLYETLPIDGSNKCLEYLHEKGVKLYCFSNSIFSSEEIKLELEQYDLAKYFETIISSADFGYRKPNKKVFEKYIKLSEKNSIWFIGNDVQCDILPALDFPCRPILLSNKTWRHPEYTEINSYDDFIKLVEE